MNTSSSSSPALSILHLEDDHRDVTLIQTALREQWPDCSIQTANNRDDFLTAIDRARPDLILSDFTLPGFNGLTALQLAQRRIPSVPFIFLSGTIGEDNAVLALQHGATDYVIKDRPARLIPAIQRALALCREAQLRRDAEIKLREQAALLDKARDAICVTDLEGRITYRNQTAADVLTGTDGGAGPSFLAGLFHHARTGSLEEACRHLLATGSWHGEFQLPGPDGKHRHIESRWSLVHDESGRPCSILLINTDDTERKEFESLLLRTQRLEGIGTLAAGIAHDLNNTFSPILMATSLLREEVPDSGLQELLKGIEASARHGSALIQQLLAFARGTDGERIEVNPHTVVRDTIALLNDTLPRIIEVETRLPPEVWPVRADSTQLVQVLMNLGINARDAMPQGGRLVYQVENVQVDENTARKNPGARPGPHVLISVADTGTGIPPELLNRIFDPFFTTKPAGKGTGLGLATVLGIMKGHQGFLKVESTPGRGTVFRLYFPATSATPARLAGSPSARPPRGAGELVLVIDDEQGVREIVRALLRAYGYRALVANDGTEGLALFRQQRHEIRAVVTDMMMPGLQGAEVIRELRQIDPALPIVAMSGIAAELARLPGDDARLALLAKPMSGPEFVRTLQRVLPVSQNG